MPPVWKAGKTPVQLLPLREAILDVRHELLDGLQLCDALFRNSRDALSRVEETAPGIPQLPRAQQGVLDAETLSEAAPLALADALREAFDAGLSAAPVTSAAEEPRLGTRREVLARGERVGEGVPHGARLHALDAARDDDDVLVVLAEVHLLEDRVSIAVAASDEARRELDAGNSHREIPRNVLPIDTAGGYHRQRRVVQHLLDQ